MWEYKVGNIRQFCVFVKSTTKYQQTIVRIKYIPCVLISKCKILFTYFVLYQRVLYILSSFAILPYIQVLLFVTLKTNCRFNGFHRNVYFSKK